jgi:hypothetical protein
MTLYREQNTKFVTRERERERGGVATSTAPINYELRCSGSQQRCMILKHHTRVDCTTAYVSSSVPTQPTAVQTAKKERSAGLAQKIVEMQRKATDKETEH